MNSDRHAIHYPPSAASDPANTDWRLAVLLEDGDLEELEECVATLGSERLRRWIRERGRRQLSRRSLALWRLVFGLDPAWVDRGDELWPL